MEAASGLAQLVKTVAVLRAHRLPPLPGLREPAPKVTAAWPGLDPVAGPADWPAADTPRRALVSGFGFGGTQVQMLLEGAARTAGTRLRPARGPRLSALGPRRNC